MDQHEAELKRLGKNYEFHRYDGAGHGFIYYHNQNYRQAQAMDAWEKVLTEQDMWKITMLLSHLNKLPPAVQEYWKTNFNVEPGVEKKEPLKERDQDHHH